MKFHLFLLGTLVLTVLTSGCESKERQDIFAAQVCIDKLDASKDLEVAANLATLRSEVEECVKPIQGFTSQEAFVLKCAAGFISGGVAEEAIIETFSALENEDDGEDSTPRVMEILSFGETPADKTLAQETMDNCKNSESKSLIGLAGLANISTILDNTAPSGDIAVLIDSYDPNDDSISDSEKVELANTIVDSRVELCDPDSGVMKKEDFCTDLNEAVDQNGGADGLTAAEKQVLIDDFLAELKKD